MYLFGSCLVVLILFVNVIRTNSFEHSDRSKRRTQVEQIRSLVKSFELESGSNCGKLADSIENGRQKSLENGSDHFIIRIGKHIPHAHFENSLAEHMHRLNGYVDVPFKRIHTVTHRFHHIRYGMVVKGFSRKELEELAQLHDEGVVLSILPVTKRFMSAYSWGLDRLNQRHLPLDGNVNMEYIGTGVSVYVVDTGLDASHVEFSAVAGRSRTVKNIYSAFDNSATLPSDTDGQGHGTHVAGTIGGKSVGVAPGANIFGLRVLNEQGEGDTSDIIGALDYVVTHRQAFACNDGSGGSCPAVVSMSLGGPCDVSDCSQDSLVEAVEDLVALGISVSVAAGNEGCNACSGSPNAAPNAINVGALDESDTVTYFSNFGQCIDVFAPGWNIVSACAHTVCGDETSYWSLAGTSMACPHVSGVVAQLLQKHRGATPTQIFDYLTCNAVNGLIHIDKRDTISKDLLLQAPSSSISDSCNPGTGCAGACSNAGVCLPSHLNSSKLQCFCDGGYFGDGCASTTDPLCSAAHYNLAVDMQDSYGDGWTFTNFVVSDSSGQVVDGALDSLCYDAEGRSTFCLPRGACYVLNVNRGYFPQEVGWTTCGQSGGAPSTMPFCVSAAGTCSMTCSSSQKKVGLLLKDSIGDGWEGAYYAVFDPRSGQQTFGGTLVDGSSLTHNLCLPLDVCSILLMQSVGAHPAEVSLTVCGHQADSTAALRICLDANGVCTVSSLRTTPECSDCNDVEVLMFAQDLTGWGSANIAVTQTQSAGTVVVANASLGSGFEGGAHMCLADGCYGLEAISSGDDAIDDQLFWLACGFVGSVPWTSRLCVDFSLGLCYGLRGCPTSLSYAHSSDLNYYFVTTGSGSTSLLIDFGNVHGANDICGLEDGCYQVFVGGGHMSASSTSERTQMHLCETNVLSIPGSATMCLSGNGTTCEVQSINQGSCSDNQHIPFSLIKLDSYGDGWGSSAKYTIRLAVQGSGQGAVVATGGLSAGMIGVDPLCLKINQCYTFALSASTYADEIVWMLCGFIGGAPQRAQQFCVTTDGCEFTNAEDDWLSGDDDFQVHTHSPSVSPSPGVPTAAPTTLKILTDSPIPVPSVAPSFQQTTLTGSPVSVPTESSISPTVESIVASNTPTTSPTFAPSEFPVAVPTQIPTTRAPTTQPSSSPTLLALKGDKILLAGQVDVAVQLMTTIVDDDLDSSAMRNSDLESVDVLFVNFAVRRVLEEAGIEVWSCSSHAGLGTDADVSNERKSAQVGSNVVDPPLELRPASHENTVVLRVTIAISVVAEEAGEVQSTWDAATLALQDALENGDLEAKTEYCFDSVRQNSMRSFIELWSLSNPELDSMVISSEFVVSVASASSKPPDDQGYGDVYPASPPASDSSLHRDALLIVGGLVVISLLLFGGIRMWLLRGHRKSSSPDIIIDFDSTRAVQHNPILELGRVGYGKVEGDEVPTQGSRTKYSHKISDRLRGRLGLGSTAVDGDDTGSDFTDMPSNALDVSTRSEVEPDQFVDDVDSTSI